MSLLAQGPLAGPRGSAGALRPLFAPPESHKGPANCVGVADRYASHTRPLSASAAGGDP
eukprot:CAMPEP_0174366294 /NCGR_PEP_ID=MMETSP0811_2-20130205/80655_1 /TAXON_ID=73025 ORGANISM="Eutreptiella gymnastica-like, Strain CCMP1594" /NCGR_SAMPLE_ID=MMETSP0811_2 /ASSEMBLY_ACC=CAM_ASM_000667 /LENGTH=58 /DNA_ID=CAMNT_0015507721 /DNA_START=216 /DNA_END=388 /DNA_ORIENTATION=-